MTLAAKVTYLVALLIGLSMGAWFGFDTATGTLERYYDARRLTAPTLFLEFSQLQYRYADPEHGKAALQSVTNFLELLEKLKPTKVQELDLAVAYTRLALLEDAAHNPEQSHAHMTNARYWYTASGGQDYSESEMESRLKAFDERLQR